MAPAAAESKPMYQKDEKALCFHGELLYDAKVLDVRKQDPKDKQSPYEYRVHYKGWKNTWDDWVPQDRLRKLTDDNRELAANLKKDLIPQSATKSASKPTAASKNRKAHSELDSGRGSEERNSSVPARGTKRGRDNDIEKVASMVKNARLLDAGVLSCSSQTPSAVRSSLRNALRNSVRKAPIYTDKDDSSNFSDPGSKSVSEEGERSCQTHENAISAENGQDDQMQKGVYNSERKTHIVHRNVKRVNRGRLSVQEGSNERFKAAPDPLQPVFATGPRHIGLTRPNDGLSIWEILARPVPVDEPEYISHATARRTPQLFWAPLIGGTAMDERQAMECELEDAGKEAAENVLHPEYVRVRQQEPHNSNKLLFFEDFNPSAHYSISGVPANPLAIDPPGSKTPFDALKFPDRLVNLLNRIDWTSFYDWDATVLNKIPKTILARLDQTALSRMPQSVQTKMPQSLAAPPGGDDATAIQAEKSDSSDSDPPRLPRRGKVHSGKQLAVSFGRHEQIPVSSLCGTSAPTTSELSHSLSTESFRCDSAESMDESYSNVADSDESAGDTCYSMWNECDGSSRCSKSLGDGYSCPSTGKHSRSTRSSSNSPMPKPKGDTRTSIQSWISDTESQPANCFSNTYWQGSVGSNAGAKHVAVHLAMNTYDKAHHIKPCIATTNSIPLSPPLYSDRASTDMVYYPSQEESFNSRPSIRITIPDHLKNLLVDDWENVTKSLLLVPLPSQAPANFIIDSYFNEEKQNRRLGSPEADVLEEFCAGMKVYFQMSLGKILLYRFERNQLADIRKLWESGKYPDWEGKGPGDCYGAEHLCRMLVNLPEMIAQTNMDAQSVARLKEEISKFCVWLARSSTRFFCAKYEKPTAEYVESAR